MNVIQLILMTTWVFLMYKYFTTKNKGRNGSVSGVKLAYLVASTAIGVIYAVI